jgi:arginine decarboxylase
MIEEKEKTMKEKNAYPSLLQRLQVYAETDMIPMHMPGHKRNTELLGDSLPYKLDITEIEGFDNLHGAAGILKEYMNSFAAFYGTKQTFFLVNGSTCGILAGIRAATKPRDKILVSRNCHKAVYNAVELMDLEPIYLLPELEEDFKLYGGIDPDLVKKRLDENPDIKLVVLTSPTYEGVVSDIRSIAALCHASNIPLLVDEAHGAHFNYSEAFPESAVTLGADIVIQSLHKTLPSLTATALAHVCGELVSEQEMARQLAIFETSSPSYILMASIEQCIRLMTERTDELFGQYMRHLAAFSEKMKALKKLRILCHGNDDKAKHKSFHDFDSGKIVISTKGTSITGNELMGMLREKHHIELEMAYSGYALAITSVCDTEDSFCALSEGLLEIDQTLEESAENTGALLPGIPERILSIQAAFQSEKAVCSLHESIGRIAAEYAWAYPPGIPIVTPGERISEEIITAIAGLHLQGIRVNSDSGCLPGGLLVVTETAQLSPKI